ncbi:MAG: hypothetical protein COC23_02225 [Hyphomicrobiales bacterium]|nr:MAG: hypothetical protein COC23_02225 [Hyphomicrobiales bacterium]
MGVVVSFVVSRLLLVFAYFLILPSRALGEYAPPIISQYQHAFTGEPHKVALLRGSLDPVRSFKNKQTAKSTSTNAVEHITIVMVGDTGYAPSRAKPNARGVAKHDSWFSFPQTTRRIASQINGDINFANVETVVSDKRNLRPISKKYNFVTHPNGLVHLAKEGFNLFSLANNHSFDYGARGIRETLSHMAKVNNLAFAGIGLNQDQAALTPVFERRNTRFAFGAIGIGAGGGGIQRATSKRPGQLNLNNSRDVQKLMKNLRSSPADYRILSVHRGRERVICPTANEISSIRNRMLDQGDVDLFIGHHAHVARGLELNKGRLIIYGLGNFLHHGTANMAGKGGCQDYSILVRVHLVRQGKEKPRLAAIEVVPLTQTHMQTRPMAPRAAARRIAILNGLARQFDRPREGAKGVRFVAQSDGSGLYCDSPAKTHLATARLCGNFRSSQLASNVNYQRALSSCGRRGQPQMIARAVGVKKRIKVATVSVSKTAAYSLIQSVKTRNHKSNKSIQTIDKKQNTKETYAQKRARWRRKDYTDEEVAAWKRHIARKRARRRNRG